MYRLPGPGGHVFQGLLLLVAHGRGREGLVLRRLVVVAALHRLVVVAALRRLALRRLALRRLVVVAALRRLALRRLALRRLALRRLALRRLALRRLVVVAVLQDHDPARIINRITMVNISRYILNWLLYQWKRVLCNQTKPKTTNQTQNH